MVGAELGRGWFIQQGKLFQDAPMFRLFISNVIENRYIN